MKPQPTKNVNTCTINQDGNVQGSCDYVAVLNRPDGSAGIFYNTDTLSLGMAIKMMCKAYMDCIQNCSPEEQREVTRALGMSQMVENLGRDIEKMETEIATKL